jgi:hypothetical protein
MSVGTDRRPVFVASVINAALVLLLPVGLCIAAFVALRFDDGATVSALPIASRLAINLVQMVVVVSLFVPLAMIVGWRTTVYADDYRAGKSNGWRGVVEAAALGLIVSTLVLSRSAVLRPNEALPYLVAYGSASALVGAGIGLVLRWTALFTLKRLS